MPFKKPPEQIKQGLCPYCYEGTLAKDPYSGLTYCTSCHYAIEVPSIVG